MDLLARKRVMLVRPRSRCGWGYMWAPLAINLEYIAASVMDVVEDIRIVNQEFDQSPIEGHIKDFQPDLFGVTMSATDHRSGLELCSKAKKKGIETIVGGYHPTAIPDELLSHKQVDMVCRGEAEVTARELFSKGSPEGVLGISYRSRGKVVHNDDRPVVDDLDTIAFPARHLRAGDECHMWTKKGERHRDQIHTSRGCWGRCTFCCEPSMSKSRQRFRSPENIMEEVLKVHRFHKGEPIVIIWGDPHFLGKPRLVDKLSDLLIEADLDIIFTAMLRADMVATRPELVAKMVKAGIVGYCMGIESPCEGQLKGTRKSLSNKLQRRAVQNLRRNHAVAGGTFVIGLPDQTKEEILTFSEYARNLGMTNAAFAIATPQAGSEFYLDLKSKGLIDEDDWTKYDQMHLVFKHEKLTGRELEELLTGCLGRFYALDIFLDDMIASQFRDHGGRKMTVKEAVNHFMERVDFIMNAGTDYQPEESAYFGTVFLKSQVNPYTRIRTETLGIHNIVDLTHLLKVMGDQKLQITLKHKGKAFAHYVIKTDRDKVHYLDITDKFHDDATINAEMAIEDLALLGGQEAKFGVKMLARILRKSRFRSLLRTAAAMFSTYLSLKDGNGGVGNGGKGTKIKLPKGFFDDFAAADGWDPERYQEILRKNGSH